MANIPPGPTLFSAPSLPRPPTNQPPYGPGLTAGADDAKYQVKYKELKRKVREIEGDNDKLHYKILQAKRNIQRMKLERAVLYERLQQVPPNPDMFVIPTPGGRLPPYNEAQHQMQQQFPPSRDPDRRPPQPKQSDRRGSIGGGPGAAFMERRPDPYPSTGPSSSSHSLPMYPPPPQPYSEPHGASSSHSRRHVPAAMPGPDIHELAARSQQHSPSARAAVHNHQRMGPGTYINREDERDRDWERVRSRDQYEPPPLPPTASSSSSGRPYYPDTRRTYSGSNSPGGSADGPSSRPDSRDHFIDDAPGPQPARRSSFRLRPITQSDDRDTDMPLSLPRNGNGHGHNHNNGGGPPIAMYAPPPPPPQQPGMAIAPPPPLDSRKRTRNEMEMDIDPDGIDPRDRDPPMYPREREPKRYHQ
ncbi:hypothetical protein HMN09_01273700 [Mycena chlorophos]|uniref:INO80 complex subunit F domain-containing protein n=1 Tax=Mycena chlorophos TaxID=658473 RepID=A0A8H6S2P6_MYCCL|nr:hypothetical protein HMN09_01273700 [Mycena chlorophos]